MEHIIEQNGIKLGYTILPRFGKLRAEIFTIYQVTPDGHEHHIHSIDKDFKRWFKEIDEIDYKNARAWVVNHMLEIINANRDYNVPELGISKIDRK
jgi:hypothetical protein